MAVEIKIQFDNRILTIPINPEEFNIERNADNDDIDIVSLGKATRKGTPSLRQGKISSFFPGPNSFYYTGVNPQTCVDFIEEIWNTENKNNHVPRITTIGLPKKLDIHFVIENFSYDTKAGEEEDIYYELTFKEYIPYGVRIIQPEISQVNTYTTNNEPRATTQPQATPKTYIVQPGDCLWNITKQFTGNGADWQELYNLNPDVIGSNPNLIYPGQELTLPDGW